jgi:hypothetical protein
MSGHREITTQANTALLLEPEAERASSGLLMKREELERSLTEIAEELAGYPT